MKKGIKLTQLVLLSEVFIIILVFLIAAYMEVGEYFVKEKQINDTYGIFYSQTGTDIIEYKVIVLTDIPPKTIKITIFDIILMSVLGFLAEKKFRKRLKM